MKTRSDRLVAAVRARGGQCSVTTLSADLALRGFPAIEVLPAATIAVLSGRLEILPGDIVAVVDARERVAA